MVSRAMAFNTGTMRGMALMSCRPPMVNGASVFSAVATSCSWAMEGMGLTAARSTIGAPLEMPPRMPPALLRCVRAGSGGSLFSLPVRRAA